MLYKFDTDSIKHAEAALLLYAMYKSRDAKSSLNGIETWDRFSSYIRAACLKSSNMAEFVQEFCKKSKIESIKPKYLDTGDPVLFKDTGELIISDGVKDYRTSIFENDDLLHVMERESLYLIMLVRERIQREKMQGETEEETDEN